MFTSALIVLKLHAIVLNVERFENVMYVRKHIALNVYLLVFATADATRQYVMIVEHNAIVVRNLYVTIAEI